MVEGIQKSHCAALSAFSDPEYLCLLDLIHKALCAADLFMLDLKIHLLQNIKKLSEFLHLAKKAWVQMCMKLKKKNEI